MYILKVQQQQAQEQQEAHTRCGLRTSINQQLQQGVWHLNRSLRYGREMRVLLLLLLNSVRAPHTAERLCAGVLGVAVVAPDLQLLLLLLEACSNISSTPRPLT